MPFVARGTMKEQAGSPRFPLECYTMNDRHDPETDLDLLWGAEEIARAANILNPDGSPNLRRCFYMLEKGLLPAQKAGRVWVASRLGLRRHFATALGQEAA